MAEKMSARAAPRIVFGAGDEAGANGVELDVPCSGKCVSVVHDVRSEAALPKMTAPALSLVDLSRVAPVCFTDGPAQAIGRAGNCNEVDMVRHEAASPDLDSIAVAPFRHQSDVEEVIVRAEERPLSAVTALRDVVWQGGDDAAGHASHVARVPAIPRMQFGRITYPTAESGLTRVGMELRMVSPDLRRRRQLSVRRFKRAIVLAIVVGLASPSEGAFPEFHGDDTELRWALAQIKVSRLIDGYIWTVGSVALVIQIYPAPMDWREEDHPPGFPIHIASVGPVRAQHLHDPGLIKKVEPILRKSVFILLLREQDGKSCILNELSGQRIYAQNGRAQDTTAAHLPCEQIWDRPEMPELSEADRLKISELLRTPPAPPKFIRRGR